MRRLILLCCTAAVVVLGETTMAASAVAAEGNPIFVVEGGLIEGSEELKVEAVSNQVLKATGLTIECTTLSASSGSVLLPGGKNSERLTYSGCFVPGKAACEVHSVGKANGTIETEELTSELVWRTKAAAENEEVTKTGTLFLPETGASGLFTELEVASCGLANGKHKVSGEVLVNNEESSAEATTHSLTAPTTAIKEYFLNEGGVATKRSVTTFTVTPFGTSTYSGVVDVSLTSFKNWAIRALKLVIGFPGTQHFEPGETREFAAKGKVKVTEITLTPIFGGKFKVERSCVGEESPPCKIKVKYEGGAEESLSVLAVTYEYPVGSGFLWKQGINLEHP